MRCRFVGFCDLLSLLCFRPALDDTTPMSSSSHSSVRAKLSFRGGDTGLMGDEGGDTAVLLNPADDLLEGGGAAAASERSDCMTST